MAEFFGFKITREKPKSDPKQSFSVPQAEDGTQVVAAGGYFASHLDMEGNAKTEADLIRRYREISIHPECDMAIEEANKYPKRDSNNEENQQNNDQADMKDSANSD